MNPRGCRNASTKECTKHVRRRPKPERVVSGVWLPFEPHVRQLESKLSRMESSGKSRRVKINPRGSQVPAAVSILEKNGMRHENELTRKGRHHISARNVPSRGERPRSASVGKRGRLKRRSSSHLQFRKSGGYQQCGPQHPGIYLYSRRQAGHRDSSKLAKGSRVQSWLSRITVSDAESVPHSTDTGS
jgi:hypothetical protein